MRAMVFDRYGEPDVMSLSEEPVPEPKDGEVLIRVGFAGVNPKSGRNQKIEGEPHPFGQVVRSRLRATHSVRLSVRRWEFAAKLR